MLGAHAGSLYRNVVAHTHDLGASGDRAPVRQQPWGCAEILLGAMLQMGSCTVESRYNDVPRDWSCCLVIWVGSILSLYQLKVNFTFGLIVISEML